MKTKKKKGVGFADYDATANAEIVFLDRHKDWVTISDWLDLAVFFEDILENNEDIASWHFFTWLSLHKQFEEERPYILHDGYVCDDFLAMFDKNIFLDQLIRAFANMLPRVATLIQLGYFYREETKPVTVAFASETISGIGWHILDQFPNLVAIMDNEASRQALFLRNHGLVAKFVKDFNSLM